jgi:pimeloyl-ACP methyl ester carboxylesterase
MQIETPLPRRWQPLRPMLLLVAVCIAFVATLALVSWYREQPPSPVRGASGQTWADADCWVELERPLRCGWLWPAQQDSSRSTALPVVVLQHGMRPSRMATIYVSGGPGGSSYLHQDGMAWREEWIERVGIEHDLILYDARGTGYARPSLDCPEVRQEYRRQLTIPMETAIEIEGAYAAYQGLLLECVQRVPAAERAAGLYATATHSRDLLELARTLQRVQGYEEIAIYGVSNGSRVAVAAAALAEQEGNPLARLVLDSWYPAGVDLWLREPQTARETLADFERWCDEKGDCLQPAGWRAAFTRVIGGKSFGDAARQVELYDEDGETALEAKLVPGAAAIWGMLLTTLRIGEDAAEIPQMIDDAIAQRWSTRWKYAAAWYVNDVLDDTFSDVAYILGECADSPQPTQEAFERALRADPEFEAALRSAPGFFTICERIGVATRPLPPTPVSTPTLVVGNRIDPTTPWRVARDAFPTLQRGHLRVLDAVGHSIENNCGLQGISAFLSFGTVGRIGACPLVFLADAERR